MPVISKELNTTRVPALVGPTAVAYIEDLQWVESPDKLFQDLLQETVTRTTSRVVLDPRQSSLDPGVTLTGTLTRFGYDTATGAVVVRYDGTLASAGGDQRRHPPLRSQRPRRRHRRQRRPRAQRRRQPGRGGSRELGRRELSEAVPASAYPSSSHACSNTSLLSPGAATIRSSSPRIACA